MATELGQLGASGYVLTRSSPSFDPVVGSVWELEYQGSRDAIRLASVSWLAGGGKVRIDEAGPVSVATVVFSGARSASDPTAPISNEEPTDRWELRTDRVDVSIFELPAVQAEMRSWSSAPDQAGNPTGLIDASNSRPWALYKQLIEEAVRNGEQLPASYFDTTNTPLAYRVYVMLGRGQDSFPTTRMNLVRVRSFTTTYQSPTRLDAVPPIYTTQSLVNTFAIPQAVQNSLPLDPASKPVGTRWGWLMTDNAFSYSPKNNLVEQTTAWAFAAWDEFVYPFV